MLVTSNTKETGMLINKQLQAAVLDTIGVNGLDTQTHPTALDATWFTKADNIVYTEGNKVTFRKGVKQKTLSISNPIGSIVEHKPSGKHFAGVVGTLYEVDLSDKDNAFINPFVTGASASNWQFVEQDEQIYFLQQGADVVEYDAGTWLLLKNTSGYSAPTGVTTFDPACGVGDFGRMWAGGISEDKNMLYYSKLEDTRKWSTGDAGFIDLKYVWGSDEIINIQSYSGKLVIFGKQNIAIYNNPWDVTAMSLDEVIKGAGCVARDSIQAVGNDLFFMSDTGVRSLRRTAEANTDKLPLQEISVTVKDEIIGHINNSTNIKSVFVYNEGLYVVSFVDLNVTYVFDVTHLTPRGTFRVSKWNFEGGRNPVAMAFSETYGLLFGQKGGHVCTYEGYYDIDYSGSDVYVNYPFTGAFSTVWISLGDGYVSSILKKILMVISGGQGTDAGLRVYKDFELTPSTTSTFKINPTLSGVAYTFGNATTLYGAAKYSPVVGLKEVGLQLAGDAKHIRFEMDGVTQGHKSSLQSMTLFYKPGKTY